MWYKVYVCRRSANQVTSLGRARIEMVYNHYPLNLLEPVDSGSDPPGIISFFFLLRY